MSGTNEVRVTNPETGGEKGSKDENYALLPWDFMGEVARLYNKGAEKYSKDNWRKGYDWSLSFSALMRHATAWWNGDFDDDETECDHMASVIFHAFALMYFRRAHPNLDDRPTMVTVATAIKKEIEEIVEEQSIKPSYDIETPDAMADRLGIARSARSLDDLAKKLGFNISAGQPSMSGYRRDTISPHATLAVSGSPAENPIEATPAPEEPSKALSAPQEPATLPPLAFTTEDAADKPDSATISVTLSMTLDEYRDLRDGDTLPDHALRS